MDNIKKKHATRERRQRAICVVTDWLMTFIAFFLFNIFRFFYLDLGDQFSELLFYLISPKLVLEQIAVPVLLLFVYWLSGYYNHPLERSRLNEFLVTFYSQLFNAVLIYMAALTNDQVFLRSENWMLIIILFILLFSFTYLGRLLVTENMLKNNKRFEHRPKTVIVGISKEAFKVLEGMRKEMGDVVAFMPFANEKLNEESRKDIGNTQIIEDIQALKNMCSQGSVEQVILVPPSGKSPNNKVLYFLYHLYPYDISIKINPDILSLITPTIRLQDILGEPFIDLSRPQISEFSKNVKRTLDVIASTLGLIILSPVFAVAAIGVKLSGPGPIIYRQERVGIHRKTFRIYKFRSMITEAEKDGVPLLSSDSDSRITRIGKWMRKYRIDELPQFWNVLKGEMSLVGPRPEREYFIEQIVKKAPWYTLVLQVRPGITSWGMVKYGYATDIDQMIERNRFDLIYLANMSVAVDFKILIHTVKTVGAGEGK